jgi:hypothetical protein
MAHYAKIVKGKVVEIACVDEDYFENNKKTRYTGTWVQTSYNTKGGIHYDSQTGLPSQDQTKALRKNYAGIGYIYDKDKDAFYAEQPFASWTLNEQSCIWEAPVSYPDITKIYKWNEEQLTWEEINEV